MQARAIGAVATVAALVSMASLASGAPADDPLVGAVKTGDVEAVRNLLDAGVGVNAALPDGTTALHWAVHRDNPAVVELLLGADASVNVADEYGVTPLWLACANRSSQIVEQLLSTGADPNATLPAGETALMRAAHTGDAEVVRLLLEAGAAVDASEATLGQTALMWAAAEGHTEAARVLTRYGADIHARDTGGYTPFLFAARNTAVTMAGLLLDAGTDVNEAALDGTTALVVATIRANIPLVEFLLDKGADPNTGPGFAPLHRAVDDPSPVGRNPGQGGLGLRHLDENSEWSFFQGPREQAKLELVGLLLTHGADPNARAARYPSYQPGPPRQQSTASPPTRGGHGLGATPFWIAASVGDVDTMHVLLASGAAPSLSTHSNVTPLMAAAGVGSGIASHDVPQSKAVQAVQLCLALGSNVNAVNVAGESALHGAVYRGDQGSEMLIRLLVDSGAQVNGINKYGWTPLIIAEGVYGAANNTRSPKAADVLRDLGAEPSPREVDRNIASNAVGLRVNTRRAR